MSNELTLEAIRGTLQRVSALRLETYRLFDRALAGSKIEAVLDAADDHMIAAEQKLGEAVNLLVAPADPGNRLALLCHAIAFQRQVKLGYGGKVRTIEPHLIKETRAGRWLLYALKVEAGQAPELRSYRLDRIESVEVTSEPFVGPERD